ncbi:MAG: hypothetical protein NTW08_02910 [Gammaproteobacteria bacterium]|nr:hypothetical protein [Gammaproteobacteria bacterium]
MKVTIKVLSWLTGVFFSLSVIAGSDPVAWSLTPASGFPTTQPGNTSIVTYVLTSHLRFPAVMIIERKITGAGFSVQDNCNGVTLAPNASCSVVITFSPIQAGTNTFQLIYGYHNNRIPLPTLQATSTRSVLLQGSIPNFPTTVPDSGTTSFIAQFINTGTIPLTNCYAGNASGTNQFTLSPSDAATLTFVTGSSNTCGTLSAKATLAPSEPCTFSGTLTSPYTVGAISLSALMNCDQASSAPSVSSTIVGTTVALTGTINQPSPFPAVIFTNQSPFIQAHFVNTGNTEISHCVAGNSSGVGQFSITGAGNATIVNNTPQNGTCGTVGTPIALQPGDSCDLYGQLTSPYTTGNITLNALVTCTGVSGSTHVNSSIQTSSGSCHTVTAQSLLLLPTNTYKYADNVVKFQITNTCTSDVVALGPVTLSSSSSPTATITTNTTYDLCSNKSLTPSGTEGSTCTVTASVIPNATGALTVSASVTPAGGTLTTATTSTTVATNQQAQHHLVFVNQCNFEVWYGVANGIGGIYSPDPNLTTYPSGAPTSAYDLPAQVLGSAPSTIDLIVSQYTNGTFWPRTGCTMFSNGQFSCATGTCTTLANSGTCASTGTLTQPQNPASRFEATIVSTAGSDGVYDSSIINGMNVPVEVKAFGPTTGNTASTAYNCSAGGAIIQPASNNVLGNCPWVFDPSSTLSGTNVNSDFYWVTPGSDDACTSSPSSGPLCGMAFNTGPTLASPVSNAPINRRLGNFLAFSPLSNDVGYTSSGQWGSVNLFTKYGMNIQIPNQTASSNYGTALAIGTNTYDAYNVLIACTPDVTATSGKSSDSCYNPLTAAQFAQCCGCMNWTNTLPATQCGDGQSGYLPGQNYDWSTNLVAGAPMAYTIGEAITWIKDGCPTAYGYQFDDPSGSFECQNDGSTQLFTSYQVTFCPGGITGLPSGATDGRSTPPTP